MEVSEGIPAEITATCSKCGLETREARKFCSRCGFPYAAVFRQPVSTLQAFEPAIKASAALFGINLLFLIEKITPERVHLPIEIAISCLFYVVILMAVHPYRAKIHFLCRRFFHRYYSPVRMVSLALLTGVVIHFYFVVLQSLGLQTLDFLDPEDLGTFVVPWTFVSAVLLAPVFEEIFFRGYLFQKFRLVLKPRDAILLQGLVFGIIHLNPATYLSHTALGILFGYFRYRTNSLLPGILFHALWNLFVSGCEYSRLF